MRTTSAITLGVVFLAATVVLYQPTSSAANAPDGKAIYNDKCSSCHQPAGQGVPNAFPPLAGNPDETAKDPSRIIKIVLDGLNTPLVVKGQKYPGGMPPWKGQLSNAEVAAVITYVRSSWGNKARAITEKEVAKIAKRPK
ncbi:MAG: cytochrome c [Candidatus Eremiobacteraeota bacterium]|nr:cytochrome c [Candidatus Eremiobacteraeota bacterium]MBV8354567.1 cytochrome c [Candidatus Eremiobacteraeota bacterium]